MTKPNQRKWLLIRESLAFQVKLAFDAVRDLLLSPVAIVCTVLDVAKGNHAGQGYFQRLMNLGHQSDNWLNLFGDLPNNVSTEQVNESINEQEDNVVGDECKSSSKVDSLFLKVEALLLEQQKNGELTVVAKQKLEHYLDKIRSRDIANSEDENLQPAKNTNNTKD